MSVGFPQDKANVDARLGQVALAVRVALADVKALQTYMAATPDATLLAMGYVQAEVNTMKSALTDLNKLATVYEGTDTQTPAYDFRTFAKLLVGTN